MGQLLYLLLIAFVAVVKVDSKELKVWNNRLIWSQQENDTWKCGNDIGGAVQCDYNSLKMTRCSCMYFDEGTNSTEFGSCLYSCFNPQLSSYIEVRRFAVINHSYFNEEMCRMRDHYSGEDILSYRTGRFCGRCIANYSLPVYSYHLSSCIPCPTYKPINWLKYICVAFVPLTIFYFVVVIFKVNLASGKLNGLIFSLQVTLTSLNLFLLDSWCHANTIKSSIYFKIIATIFGPVNLDFFRDVYPKFCIGPHFSVLHILALDYLVALHPFFLIGLTYILIKLYDNNFVLVVWAWKPFRYLLSTCGRFMNKSISLVETFCTFVLLSSVKILSISVGLLAKTRAYDETGVDVRKKYVYFDANIEYFSVEHRQFGILAIFIAFIFVFLPFILILLYPCKFFQKSLNYINWNFNSLHVFMDAFQGSYRIKPVDLRWFSVYYILVRFVCLFIVAFFQSITAIPFTTVILITSSILFAAVQPYKNKHHNMLDIVSLLFLSFFYASVTLMLSTSYLDIKWVESADIAFVVALTSILLFYILMFVYAMFGSNIKALLLLMKKNQPVLKDNLVDENLDYYRSNESRSLLTVSSKQYS